MENTSGIVLASGCFDVLHPGHLAFLEAAHRHGDVLVVSVTSDEYVSRKKGDRHPLFPVHERLNMLRALWVVDRAILCDADDAVSVIHDLKPSVYAKGVEYLADDPGGRLQRERDALEKHGGRMVFIDARPRYSSTAIMKALA